MTSCMPIRRTVHVPHHTHSRITKAHFLKLLERFCSMLLLHVTTNVRTLVMPRLLFWNENFRFSPNSKFESARED